MNRKVKKKKTKIILILLLICIVIIICLIMSLRKATKEKEYEESIQEFQEFRKEYEEQTILPRKIYELYNYEGSYDRDYLYKNMKKFVDYLDYLNSNVNISNAIQFYEKESSNILDILGIDNQDNFEIFVKNIEGKNLRLDEFKYAEIEVGSSHSENGYFCFGLYLYYGENAEVSKFNVAFSERKNNSIDIIYEVAE